MVYSDVEFDGKSGFAIECSLELKSDGVMDCAKLLPTDVPTSFHIWCCGLIVRSIKIHFVQISDILFGRRI